MILTWSMATKLRKGLRRRAVLAHKPVLRPCGLGRFERQNFLTTVKDGGTTFKGVTRSFDNRYTPGA